MQKFGFVVSVLLVAFFLSIPVFGSTHSVSAPALDEQKGQDNGITVHIAGTVNDSHHEPIGEVEIEILSNGQLIDRQETADNGKFVSTFLIPQKEVPTTQIEVRAEKTSFKTRTLPVQASELAQKGKKLYLTKNIMLLRTIGPAFWIATIVFVLAYILIAFELLHRTIAAMLGAAFMLVISYTIGTINPSFHILSYEAAIKAIDMNVIFLLMGMMVIVGVLKHTGVFQWCAYMAYRLAGGKIFILSIYLMIFTAVTSAFLDNVTTMLLLTGVAIEICVALSLNPLHLLMPLILASNIGGTATMIGDPPNILIGSYSGLSFVSFVESLAPICLVSLLVLLVYTKILWGRKYAAVKIDNVQEYIKELKQKYTITDKTLLTYGLGILAFVVFLFLTESYWHMEVSVAALFGSALLVTIAVMTHKVNLIELIEKDIEWPTLMFFIFLFMLVGAVESAGLLSMIADWILHMSQGNFVAACTFILWIAAIMSAFVDNIPFTATMLPIVAYLSQVIPGAENTLWWALALGACFGGNGTIIGASANVVTVGIAESRGYRTTFGGFMKTAFPYMIITIFIAQAWLLLFKPS
jgi:Na+/H+ antiporter NhaD/arsenite permease-like protein